MTVYVVSVQDWLSMPVYCVAMQATDLALSFFALTMYLVQGGTPETYLVETSTVKSPVASAPARATSELPLAGPLPPRDIPFSELPSDSPSKETCSF